MTGPKPTWDDPTKPEKSHDPGASYEPPISRGPTRRRSVLVVLFLAVALLGTFLALTTGGGDDPEPRQTRSTPTTTAVTTVPTR